MTTTDPSLENRICHNARVSGFLEGCGDRPKCIGPDCSEYEGCTLNLIVNARQLAWLKTHPKCRSVK